MKPMKRCIRHTKTFLPASVLEFRAVEADSGAIGGKGTHEFMALADAGEDTVVICESCDYSANMEMAEVAGEENTYRCSFRGKNGKSAHSAKTHH